MQVNTKNMTRKVIDTDTVGKTGINLGTLEFQAETDMGPALLPTAYLSGTEVTESYEDPQNVGGQGRLAMRYVNLGNGRHLNERFA